MPPIPAATDERRGRALERLRHKALALYARAACAGAGVPGRAEPGPGWGDRPAQVTALVLLARVRGIERPHPGEQGREQRSRRGPRQRGGAGR